MSKDNSDFEPYVIQEDGTIQIKKIFVDDYRWAFAQVGIGLSRIKTPEDFREAEKKIGFLRSELLERAIGKMPKHMQNVFISILNGDDEETIRKYKIKLDRYLELRNATRKIEATRKDNLPRVQN